MEMSKKYLVILTIILINVTSCVSKKKFLEMQDGRLKAETLASSLDEENNAKAVRIEALIEDFEIMKNELLESNAIKDQYIDSLNSQIYILSDNLSQQKESLQESSFNLDFEKQRLTNAIETKDQAINSLQINVNELENSVSSQNSIIDQKNFDIKRVENQVNVLEGKIQTGENRLVNLQTQLENVKNETSNLKAQIKEKDAEILKLTNNVKLLKSQIGQ